MMEILLIALIRRPSLSSSSLPSNKISFWETHSYVYTTSRSPGTPALSYSGQNTATPTVSLATQLSVCSITLKSPDTRTRAHKPEEYQDILNVFSNAKAAGLPSHREYDCAVALLLEKRATTQGASISHYFHKSREQWQSIFMRH